MQHAASNKIVRQFYFYGKQFSLPHTINPKKIYIQCVCICFILKFCFLYFVCCVNNVLVARIQNEILNIDRRLVRELEMFQTKTKY